VNDSTLISLSDLPPSLARAVDQTCDRFEAAWQGDSRPSLEAFLAEASAELYPLLLRELIPLDVQYRRRAGERPGVQDYQQRFPSLEPSWLTRVLGEGGADSTSATLTPANTPPANTLLAPVTPAQAVEGLPRACGDYELLEQIGRGGMGVVFKARQKQLDRVVALKMIRKAELAGPEELARFRAEAEAVARLQHPHIVQIHEVGESNGGPFFSLEYVDGGNLADLVDGTPLPALQAARLVELLARAMHFAHQRGIIHRDLKPHNVLLARSDRPEAILLGNPVDPAGPFEPKIGDFGLAKRLDGAPGGSATRGLTQTGVVMGTPSYMAPEQALGKGSDIGPPADTYALGAILYELLAGRPPFKGETPLDTLNQVVNDEPVSPVRLQPKVPRDLETICLKCLAKDQPKRYATAEALAEDLRRFRKGEPINARPTPTWERLRKWARRKPSVAALAGALALAVLALVAFNVVYPLYLSERERRLEEQEKTRVQIGQDLLEAGRHEGAGRWEAAHTALARAQAALDAQPGLAADPLGTEIHKRLSAVRRRLEEQQRRQQAQQRLPAFWARHDRAMFYVTSFTGEARDVNRGEARDAIRQALAVYQRSGKADLPGPTLTLLQGDRLYHSLRKHRELATACYELLLLWADIEAATEPNRRGAEKALILLKRAAQLGRAHGLQTRTYQQRLAHYLAQREGKPFPPESKDRPGPTGTLDWFLEGLECYRAGQYERGRECCAEVVRRQGSHFWARYVLALCHLGMRRRVEGKAELTVCIVLRPEYVWPRLIRGFAATELGRQQTRTNPGLAANEFREALVDFDWALKQDRDPLVQYVGLVNRGVLFIRQTRWKEAVRDLRRAVKLAPPGGYQAAVNLAQALRGMGQPQQALATLTRAVERMPNLALLYHVRAKMHLKGKDHAAARADFERAIAREPKGSKSPQMVENLVELGRLLHGEGKYREALARYDQALQLNSLYMRAQLLRADTLLAQGKHAEAGQALDHYLADTSQKEVPPEAYQLRGLLHEKTGKMSAAIEMYLLGLRKNPRDSQTRCRLGWAHLETNAVGLALADFDRCLRQDPNNADALAGRGNARIRLKLLDGALDDARAAAKQGPLTPLRAYHLARIHARAAILLEAEVRTVRPGRVRRTAQRRDRCKASALGYLRRLRESKEWPAWRKQVEADPAFTAIRRESGYFQLAARQRRTGS
jgi:serine/threonine protein kinase/Tfp pilus assembly protein PilF